MKLRLLGFSALLSGCALSTGILPVGPDTYTVTERFPPIRGGSSTSEQTALVEGNAYCARQGKQFISVDMMIPPSRNPYGTTGYTVTFRCLSPGDPALTNARAPSSVIELRNR